MKFLVEIEERLCKHVIVDIDAEQNDYDVRCAVIEAVEDACNADEIEVTAENFTGREVNTCGVLSDEDIKNRYPWTEVYEYKEDDLGDFVGIVKK